MPNMKSLYRVFFSVCWEWGRVPCNWENSAVLVRFGKSSKEYKLDKLRKFTLNKHFIQTSVNYYPFSDLVFRKFYFGSLQQIGNFWPPFGKKRYYMYLALGLGPYNGPKFTRKKSLLFLMVQKLFYLIELKSYCQCKLYSGQVDWAA